MRRFLLSGRSALLPILLASMVAVMTPSTAWGQAGNQLPPARTYYTDAQGKRMGVQERWSVDAGGSLAVDDKGHGYTLFHSVPRVIMSMGSELPIAKEASAALAQQYQSSEATGSKKRELFTGKRHTPIVQRRSVRCRRDELGGKPCAATAPAASCRRGFLPAAPAPAS